GCSAEAIRSVAIAIRGSAAVLRIVLPRIAAANIRAAADVIASPHAVVDESIVAVDRNVVVASPSATPSPAAADCGADHHAYAKRNCHASGVVARRRIGDRGIRIIWRRRTVDDGGIVAGNV